MRNLAVLSMLSLSLASLIFTSSAFAGHGCCKSALDHKTTVKCHDSKGSNCSAGKGCENCADGAGKQINKIF